MYPNQEDARFDFDYYRTKHMDLVQAHLSSFGLIKTEVDKGMVEAGAILRADIPIFTNVTPIRQISEILD